MAARKVNTKDEVEAFLRRFFPKMEVFGVIFTNRGKNNEALKMLGITPSVRKEYIKEITSEDYVETIMDGMSYGDMWVFGRDCDGVELYIKIAMGEPNSNTICISFHAAEYPLRYAFK